MASITLAQLLPKDVVEFCILPYLMPSAETVREPHKKCMKQVRRVRRTHPVSKTVRDLVFNVNMSMPVLEKHRHLHLISFVAAQLQKLRIKGVCRREIVKVWCDHNYPRITREWIRSLMHQRLICYAFPDVPEDLRPDTMPLGSGSVCVYCLKHYPDLHIILKRGY